MWWGHQAMGISLLQAGQDNKVSHAGGQLCLSGQALIKYQGSGKLPQLAVLGAYCHTLMLWEISTVGTTPLGDDGWELPARFLPPWALFSLLDFNLQPSAVINYNCEYTNVFCRSFEWILKAEGGLEDLLNPSVWMLSWYNRRVAVTESKWPTKPKILTLQSFPGKSLPAPRLPDQ